MVTAERVYFQCPKALVRSDLWNPDKHVPASCLPTTGQILAALSDQRLGGEEYDKVAAERVKQTLY